jgi:phosphoribosylaminoimidazole-succinocarboxamide synthase
MTLLGTPVIDLNLPLYRRGKVRDTFEMGDRLLMVASDRISAFDVVLPTPIPGKGIILTQLSAFWFHATRGMVPNHFISTDLSRVPEVSESAREQLAGRSMIVKRAERIDFECVVRGYLAGSAWKEYRQTGTVSGHSLPKGMLKASRLPEPLFTPAAKNDQGHDENITLEQLEATIGSSLAASLGRISREIYDFAYEHAIARGVILADSKFEFGLIDGQLALIDEILTPDSSRFWDSERYEPGTEPASYDKQFVRDWLSESGWNGEPPGPSLPESVVAGTRARYEDAYRRLTGQDIDQLPVPNTRG